MKEPILPVWRAVLCTMLLVALPSMEAYGQDQDERIKSALRKVWPDKAVSIEPHRGGYQVRLELGRREQLTGWHNYHLWAYRSLKLQKNMKKRFTLGKRDSAFTIPGLPNPTASWAIQSIALGLRSSAIYEAKSGFHCGNVIVLFWHEKGAANRDDQRFLPEMLSEDKSMSTHIAQTLLAEGACTPDPVAPAPCGETFSSRIGSSGITVGRVVGEVELIREGTGHVTVCGGEAVNELDRIYTGMGAQVELILADGSRVVVEELTDVKVARMVHDPGSVTTRLWVKAGEIDADVLPRSGLRSDFKCQTPTATCSVRGTRFKARFDRQQFATRFDVEEGKVLVTPTNTSLRPRELTAGEWIIVYRDRIEPADAGALVDPAQLRGLAMQARVGRPGTQFTMPVLLNNVATDAAAGIANVNFQITYDPRVVQVSGKIARGNIYGGGTLFEANARERGRIRIGFAGETGITRTGTVAQIPFEVVGRPGQHTELRIRITQSQTAAGQNASLETTHGRVTIPSPSDPVGGGRSGAGGDPGGGGHGDRPLGTNPDGTAVGDSDGDQRLTAKDAEAALQMSVGLRPVDTNLDVDQDGRVQSGDARQILQEASRTVGVR